MDVVLLVMLEIDQLIDSVLSFIQKMSISTFCLLDTGDLERNKHSPPPPDLKKLRVFVGDTDKYKRTKIKTNK